MEREILGLAEKICSYINDKKAQDIQVLDIAEMTSIADCFVISSAKTPNQTKAIADQVREKLAQEHMITPLREEGYLAGRWIILDYASVIVHIFCQEEREFYALERLWTNGENIRSYPFE